MRQSINSDQYSLNISQILSAFTEEFLKQENQDQQIRQLGSIISTKSASNNDLLLKIVEGTRFFEDYEIKDRRSREELKQYTEQLLKLLSSYHDYLLLILDSKEQDSSHITSIQSLVPNGHFYQRLLEVKIDDFFKLTSTVKNITFLFNKLILDFEKARSMAPDQLKDTVEKISLTLNTFLGNIPFACLDGLQISLISTIKSLNPKSTLEKIVQDKFDIYTSQVGSIVSRGDERHCQSFLIDVLSLKDHSATLRTIDAFYINLYSSTKLALIFSIAEDLNHNKFFTQLLSGYQKYYDELPADLLQANILAEFELLTPQQLQKLNDAIEDVKDNFSPEDCEEFGLNDTFSFFNSDGGTIMTPQHLNQKLIKDICKKYSEKYPHFFDQEKVDFFKHLPSKESLFYSQDSDYLDPEKMSILFKLFQRIEDGDEPEIKKQKLDKVASGLFLLREIIKNTNTFDISQTQSNRSRVNFYSICFFSNFAREKGFEFLKLFYEDESLSKIRDEYQQLSPILDFFKKEILKIKEEERLITNSLGNEAKYLEFKEIFLQGNYSERDFDSSEIRALKQQKRERFRRFATSELNQQALLSIIKMLVDSGNSQALGELLSEFSITEFLTIDLENSAIYNQEIIKTLCQFFCAQEEIRAEELTELKSILINADPNVFETALSIKRADVAEDLLAFLEQDICNLASNVAIKMLTMAFEYEKPNLVTKILEILTRSKNSISNVELEAFFRATDYNNGGTLIHALILSNNKKGLEIILEFLSNKRMLGMLNLQDQFQRTPLILASYLRNIDIIKMLLKREVDEFDVNSSDDIGLTTLHLASEHGYQEIVKMLLEKGANVNLSTNTGATPLLVASENGHTEVIEALIQRGADVNKANINGATPLLVASKNGHTEAIEALIQRGADVNKANINGETPLLVASKNGHTEAIKALIQRGADVNKANINDATPLLMATHNGHTEAIKALIQRGADVNKAHINGATPLLVASKMGHTEAIEALIQRGADVNKANIYGATPLYIASQKGHKEIVELLLKKGATVDLVDSEGVTALHLASENGHVDIARILEFFSNLQHSSNSEDVLKLFGEKVDFMQDLEKSIKRDQSTSDLTTASEINAYKQELEKQLITRLALLKLYSYTIGAKKFPTLSKEQKIEIIELGNSQLHSSLRDFYDLVDNPDLKAIIDKTPQELIILAKQISTKITYRITSDGNSIEEFSEDRARKDTTEILRNICRKSLAPDDLESGNSLISEIISEIIQQQNQNPDTTLSGGSSSRFTQCPSNGQNNC